MKRIGIAVAVLFALVAQPRAQASAVCEGFGQLAVIPGSYEDITVSSTAIGFTSTKYAPDGQDKAVYAYVSIQTNAIRFRDDGLSPTAAVGHPVAAAERFGVCGEREIQNLRMIRQSADATASVTYYRRK